MSKNLYKGTVALKGGINFTPDNLPLEIQNDGGEIKFHLDQAMLEKLKSASSFVPVVVDIRPLKKSSGILEGLPS